MTTGAPPGDVLGFSREARGFGAGVCLAAMLALSAEMAAEGISGDPAELSRRYAQIRSFARSCPAASACRAPDCAAAHPERATYQLSIFSV
jgi:hypothetical protein